MKEWCDEKQNIITLKKRRNPLVDLFLKRCESHQQVNETKKSGNET